METPNFGSYNELLHKLRNDYANTYGLDFPAGIFKKINTNPNATGVPHLNWPKYGPVISYSGIDSLSLNPVGVNSADDGIIFGNSAPYDLNLDVSGLHRNKFNARTFGLKLPFNFVGWGYDIFGQPAPNFNKAWTASGVYSTGTAMPTGNLFLTRSNTLQPSGQPSGSLNGTDTSFSDWLAGPIDLRWDNHRKVWTGRYGVYPALITRVYLPEGFDVSTPQFPSNIHYDAIIYDGSESGICVTGIRPDNSKNDDWKVYPIPTGKSCLISHMPINGRPGFGLIAWEKDYGEVCSASSNTQFSQVIYGGGLVNEGLTGYTQYNQYDILVGNSTGTLDRRQLLAGTGINIDFISNTGLVTIGFAPGVSFTIGSGINYDITQLSGFIGPVQINQGGTGATGKIFVDITTSQNIGGIKQFSSGVVLPSGNNSYPGLLFSNGLSNTKYGLSFNRSDSITVVSSGKNVAYFHPTGVRLSEALVIQATESLYAPLTVWQPLSGYDMGAGAVRLSTNLTEWKKNIPTGSMLGYMDQSGYLGAQGFRVISSGNDSETITIKPPNVWTTGYILKLPSSSGTLALRSHVSIYEHVKVSGYYRPTSDDHVIFVNSQATGCVILLPDASLISGKVYNIKDYAGLAGTNLIEIRATGIQKIDGTGLLQLNSDYGNYTIMSDNINWYIL